MQEWFPAEEIWLLCMTHAESVVERTFKLVVESGRMLNWYELGKVSNQGLILGKKNTIDMLKMI